MTDCCASLNPSFLLFVQDPLLLLFGTQAMVFPFSQTERFSPVCGSLCFSLPRGRSLFLASWAFPDTWGNKIIERVIFRICQLLIFFFLFKFFQLGDTPRAPRCDWGTPVELGISIRNQTCSTLDLPLFFFRLNIGIWVFGHPGSSIKVLVHTGKNRT